MRKSNNTTNKSFYLAVSLLSVLALTLTVLMITTNNNENITKFSHNSADMNKTSLISNARASGNSPNIVEILVDDMRTDDLRFMPNLKTLMQNEGFLLANGFSSDPLCCPARASFLSGQQTHNHGVFTVTPPYGYRAFDDRDTIATHLQEAGYRNGFIGKYLNNYGSDIAKAPILKWIENGRVGVPPAVQSQYYVPDGWEQWRGSLQGVSGKPAVGSTYNYFKYAWSENGKPTAAKRGKYSSRVIANQAIEMINIFAPTSTSNPFFISANFTAPHKGAAERRFDKVGSKLKRGKCGAKKGPSAPRWAYKTAQVSGIQRGSGVKYDGTGENDVSDKPGWPGSLPNLNDCDRKRIKKSTKLRAASLIATDAEIARIVNTLKATGQWDNTLFLFWSDNGFFQGEHNRKGGKGVLLEPSIRVPMLFKLPGGVKAGVHDVLGRNFWNGNVVYAPADPTDLNATLLDYANTQPMNKADGVSLRQDFNNSKKDDWNTLFGTETSIQGIGSGNAWPSDLNGKTDPRVAIGVRTAQYSYTKYLTGDEELYDLYSDPGQENNLIRNGVVPLDYLITVNNLRNQWNLSYDCVGVNKCRASVNTDSPNELRMFTKKWYSDMSQMYDSW